MDDKTAGFQISLKDGEAVVDTKSTPAELGNPAVDKFKLKIVRDGASDPLYEGTYTDQTIPASAGTYTISASYGENPVLALDAPYYLGDTSNVEIKEGEKKDVILNCKVANALASAYFPADTELKKVFSSYYVKVLVGGKSCSLTPDSKKSAYFQAGKEVSFYFEGKKMNGADFSEELKHKDLPSTLQAGHHLQLTLKLSDDLLLDIAKVEIKKETITSDIPMAWLPRPKIEAVGFENNVLAFAETESKTAKLNLNTASALQDLKLKFTFGDPQFESLNDKEYLLSVPTDKEKVEKVLGIVLPEIGAEKASLDLTSIVAKLRTDAGMSVENKVEVDVKANNRWSSEEIEGESPNLAYILRCDKPEMAVSVQPGNVWTKEFTIDELTVTTGNPEVIKSNLKYQYKEKSEGDNAWKDIQDMKVLFNEHPQNRSYQVRAVYRDAVMTDAVDVELENPVQLPNSGMEEWTDSERYGQPYYQPWNQGDVQWWDTNNNETMQKKYSTYTNYKTFPTVTYTNNGYVGKAAVIRSIAANNGVASEWVSGTPYRGKLIIGTTNEDGSYVEGRPFSSRPTAVSFYYTYESLNNEKFAVYVELLNEDIVVSSNSFISEGQTVNQFSQVSIPLVYDEQNLKAVTSIRLRCYSVEEGKKTTIKKQTIEIPAGSRTVYSGSCLTVDNFELIYDR